MFNQGKSSKLAQPALRESCRHITLGTHAGSSSSSSNCTCTSSCLTAYTLSAARFTSFSSFYATQDHAQVLDTWQRLLVHPATTLAAASSLRGRLLGMLSLLVDAVQSGKASGMGVGDTAAATAALRLLEFNPNISR